MHISNFPNCILIQYSQKIVVCGTQLLLKLALDYCLLHLIRSHSIFMVEKAPTTLPAAAQENWWKKVSPLFDLLPGPEQAT